MGAAIGISSMSLLGLKRGAIGRAHPYVAGMVYFQVNKAIGVEGVVWEVIEKEAEPEQRLLPLHVDLPMLLGETRRRSGK